MAEIGTKPSGTATDLDNLNWANTAAIGVDVVEPALGKRNTGWVDQEEPPYNFFNWFWRLVALAVTWFTATHVRAFEELETATQTDPAPDTPLVEGEVFRIDYRNGIKQPLSEAWGVTGVAAVDVTHCVCDGEFLYYTQGQVLHRASRTTGASLANRDLGATINDLSADGFVVCATTDDQAPGELFCVDRLTLADSPGFPLAATINGQRVVSNGFRVCYSDDSSSVQIINESTGLTIASPNYGNTPVRALAIDYERLYVTGADAGGGIQLRAYRLSNGALEWSSVLWVTPAGSAVMNALAADGERLFIAGAVATKGGISWNLAAYDRESGSRIWLVDAGGAGTTITALAVDEQYVWAIDDNDTLYQYTKAGEYVKMYTPGASTLGIDSDADAVFVCGGAAADTFRLRRLHRGNPSKSYVIASGTDPNRRPFHKLAIPGDKL